MRREINIRNLAKNLISTPKNEIHIRTETLSKNLESQITILEYFNHIKHPRQAFQSILPQFTFVEMHLFVSEMH